MIIESLRSEYLRYKNLAEGAIAQVDDNVIYQIFGDESNSIAIIMNHLSGNLKSRFTDFFTSDGEKPWRHRDEEFEETKLSRDELLHTWEEAWSVLWNELENLRDEQLQNSVKIRGKELAVIQALHRSLTHFSYHVGQIVFIAKSSLGKNWKSLSIPKSKSRQYNENPVKEKGIPG
ncbi:MAG: DUF1572 family protein [Calditrichota bacterium]